MRKLPRRREGSGLSRWARRGHSLALLTPSALRRPASPARTTGPCLSRRRRRPARPGGRRAAGSAGLRQPPLVKPSAQPRAGPCPGPQARRPRPRAAIGLYAAASSSQWLEGLSGRSGPRPRPGMPPRRTRRQRRLRGLRRQWRRAERCAPRAAAAAAR